MIEVRVKKPKLQFVQLSNQAIDVLIDKGRWSEDRRRKITSVQQLGLVVPKIKLLDKDRTDAMKVRDACTKRLNELEKELAYKPSKQSELDNLTDSEVLAYFGRRVLELMQPNEIIDEFEVGELLNMAATARLAGYAVERVLADRNPPLDLSRIFDTESPRPKHQIHRKQDSQPNGRHVSLPRVAIVGTHADQFTRLEKQFSSRARLFVVDKMSLDGRYAQRAPTTDMGCLQIVALL